MFYATTISFGTQQFIAVLCKINVSCHLLQCVNDIKGTGNIKNNVHAEKMGKVVSNFKSSYFVGAIYQLISTS